METKQNIKKKTAGGLRAQKLLLVAALFLCGVSSSIDVNAGTRKYSVSSGNWSATSTWSYTSAGAPGAPIPANGDTVIIEKGHSITVIAAANCDSIVLLNDNVNVSTLHIINTDFNVLGGMSIRATKATGKKDLVKLQGNSTMTIGGDLVMVAKLKDSRIEILNSSILTVNGDIYLIDSAGQMSELKLSNNSLMYVYGDIHFIAAAKDMAELKLLNNAVVHMTGNFVRYAPNYYGELNATQFTEIYFDGTSPQIFDMVHYTGKTTTWNYGDVFINNPSGVTLNANITQTNPLNTVLDSITVQSGATLYSGGYSIALGNFKQFELRDNATYHTTTTDVSGGMLNPAGNAYHRIHDNSTVIFAATSQQNVPNPDNSEDYGNVIITGGAKKILTDNVDIRGDLTIVAGSNLDADNTGNYSVNLGGDWIDNGIFYERQGEVVFDGTGPQLIDGVNETFYGLEVNKPSGDVTLDVHVTVTDDLTLQSGDIVLGANNLTVDVAGAVAGAPGASSYVQADQAGVMKKNYNAISSFSFPVGDIDEYSPFTVNMNAATFTGGEYLSLHVTDAMHPDMGPGNYITRYWTVGSNGFSSINYDVSYTYLDADISGAEVFMSARWIGSWVKYEHTNAPINNLFSTTGITDIPAHDFTAGGGGALLPIEMISFTAEASGRDVLLTWITASEVNNAYFTVEKSINGVEFTAIGQVAGKGTSSSQSTYTMTDKNAGAGTVYYRLKQTDFDNRSAWSDPIAVRIETITTLSMTAYPNPVMAGQTLKLRAGGASVNEKISISIFDAAGKLVMTGQPVVGSGGIVDLGMVSLPAGLYYIHGTGGQGQTREKLVVTDIVSQR